MSDVQPPRPTDPIAPRIVAGRGVYETSFWLAVGVFALVAVDGHGVIRAARTVRTRAEYDAAYETLTRELDAYDPPPTLQLVD